MTLRLLIDDRERSTIQHFDSEYLNVEIEVRRLQIGDYTIAYGNHILATIERKTWTDLAASIKDRRIENIEKLIDLRNTTGCRIIYLIEGKARHKDTRKFARVSYKNLLAHLDQIMIEENICMIYSDNEADSAKRLIDLCNTCYKLDLQKICLGLGDKMDIDVEVIDLCDEPSSSTENVNHGGEGLTMLSTVVPKTDSQVIYDIWCCVPEITTATASIFIDAGYHISDLILGKLSKAEISTMRYPNGTIIGKRADKIIKICNLTSIANHKYYCNILSSIPRITKKTAAIILTKANIEEIFNGEISEDELALINKTEKSKIGKAAASSIYKFLVNV
ncbi:MAG: ERCC4 domain-containing protein [Cetobacterium sp.]